MRKVLLVAGVIIGLVSAAHAQGETFCSSQTDLVKKYIGPLVKPVSSQTATSTQAVGAVVVTVKLGELPCYFGFGEIELGSGVAPDQNTIFELASVTKVFTTAILAMREGQGLKVDVSVKPNLPPGYVLQPEEQDVTFQQLATFTGGFWWSDPPPDFATGDHFSQSDFVDAVNSLDPTDPSGKAFGPIPGEADLPTFNFYSNGSIGFLGQILMHMDSSNSQRYHFHGPGFSNWISDNLTGPLNMPNTAVNPGGVWATGYKFQGGKTPKYKAEPPFDWVPWGAAGALRSNAADMQYFLAANICAHHLSDPACTGLPKDVLTALATAHLPNEYTPSGTLVDPTIYVGGCQSQVVQAYAWRYNVPPVPNPNNVTPIISKNGGHPGFSTWIGFNPHKSYGLVILMNTGGISTGPPGNNIIEHTQ